MQTLQIRFSYQLFTSSFIIFMLAAFSSFSQTDSVLEAQADSLLISRQDKGNQLLIQADSAHIADSLQHLELMTQITNLKSKDKKKKAELEAQVDSLQRQQEKRVAFIKRQVDSLRENTVGVPVIIFEDTVFYIYSKLGPFSPRDRSASISQKVELLVDENLYDPKSLHIHESQESDDVMHDEMILFSVTDRDAFWVDLTRKQAAENYQKEIEKSVEAYLDSTSLWSTLKRIFMVILVLFAVFFSLKILNRFFTWMSDAIFEKGKHLINGIKIKEYEFLSVERETQFLESILNLFKWVLILLIVYISLPIIFNIFPSTQGIADTLFDYILTPFKKYGKELLDFIPDLITIIIIIFIARYFIRVFRFFSLEIEKGKLQLSGFYPDWAKPTFNLIKIIIYAFTLILIFPYLPGSDSPVFRGMSVFLGLLLSLGSSSAVGNIIAGLVITYMRAFKIGDRVKIGDVIGDVTEKTMLVTKIRTIKNEDVTIPNLAILNGSTINYSSSALELGLILNTSVTIGYDIPWRKVHQLLIDAAIKTGEIKKDPTPFVLQTSLDDFYVSYQINAYTNAASKSATIYSDLYSKIQDSFNEAGIEIMSPHYRAERDGNKINLPDEYLPSGYKTPGFNVNMNNKNQE